MLATSLRAIAICSEPLRPLLRQPVASMSVKGGFNGPRQQQITQKLVDAFNPATVDQVMCRSLVSVAHDGSMYDCDFNQALAMPLQLQAGGARSAQTIWDVDSLDALTGAEVNTGNHCFGCTAGMGSS